MVCAPSGELRRWRRENHSWMSSQISSATLPHRRGDCDCSLPPHPVAMWRTDIVQPVSVAASLAEATQALGTVKDSPQVRSEGAGVPIKRL